MIEVVLEEVLEEVVPEEGVVEDVPEEAVVEPVSEDEEVVEEVASEGDVVSEEEVVPEVVPEDEDVMEVVPEEGVEDALVGLACSEDPDVDVDEEFDEELFEGVGGAGGGGVGGVGGVFCWLRRYRTILAMAPTTMRPPTRIATFSLLEQCKKKAPNARPPDRTPENIQKTAFLIR